MNLYYLNGTKDTQSQKCVGSGIFNIVDIRHVILGEGGGYVGVLFLQLSVFRLLMILS